MKQKQNHYWVIDTPEKAKRAYEILTKAGERIDEEFGTAEWLINFKRNKTTTAIEIHNGEWVSTHPQTVDAGRTPATLDELAEMLGVGENAVYQVMSPNGDVIKEGERYYAIYKNTKGIWVHDRDSYTDFKKSNPNIFTDEPNVFKAFKSREAAEQWVAEQNGKSQNDMSDHWSVDRVIASPKPYSPTRLEYFAGLALQGLLAGSFDQPIKPSLINEAIENTSKWATAYARALITELDKEDQI